MGLTECVAIVTLNVITIIIFIKNRNLRKRSTYLVMNLAVADMFAGARATHFLFYRLGGKCNIWKYNSVEHWADYVKDTLLRLFTLSSLTNIAAISVERLHATLRPFRHRLIKNWVYALTIAIVWVTAGLVSIALTVLLKFEGRSYRFFLSKSFQAICLSVISIFYATIIIKVRCGAQPQHHGAASRERKLTMTLLIVTVVSLLLYLPDMIYHLLDYTTDIISAMPKASSERLHDILNLLYFGNSLVNPMIYAIRMPEYRSAVLALFRRRPQPQRQVPIPLNDL